MYDVEVREIGEQEWLPFLDEGANLEYAQWIQRRINKNYRRIETRVVPWDTPCAHPRGKRK